MIDYNGTLYPDDSPLLAAKDIGFYYGLGLYETFYVRDKKVAFFEDHMNRFFTSVNYFNYQLPENFSENLKNRIKQLLDHESTTDARLRLTFSQGNTPILQPDKEKTTSILSLQPISTYAKAIKLMVSEIRKPYPAIFPAHVKYTANIYSLYSYREAQRNQFDEGVLLTQNGLIAEGSFCNVFWLDRNGLIKTPSTSCSILDGVTRIKLLQAAQNAGITIERGEYLENELDLCEELYISSSTRGIIPVKILGERIFPEGFSENVQKIKQEYEKLLQESLNEWH